MTHFSTRRQHVGLAALLAGLMILPATASLAQDATTPEATAPASEAPATAAPATPSMDAVVATIGGETITEADLAFAAEDLGQELGNIPPQDRRAFLVTVLIDMKVMAQAGRAAGLDQTDIFKQRQQYLVDRALRRAYFNDMIASEVTEENVRAAYDEFVASFVPEEEIRARHILVATKEEADTIKAEIEGGKPFEILAMEASLDPGGAQNGGDLGYFGRGMMVKPFEDAAFALTDAGQLSEPVQSQFGWHVIKLEDRRTAAPPPFEQMAGELQQRVLYDAFNSKVGALKETTVIDIPDPALAAAVAVQSGQDEAEAEAAE
jgi:peptidyl-prolyl cis-trans isomerase C